MQGHGGAAGRCELPVQTVDGLTVGRRLAEDGRWCREGIGVAVAGGDLGSEANPRGGGREQDATAATGHGREIGHRTDFSPFPLGETGGGVDGS